MSVCVTLSASELPFPVCPQKNRPYVENGLCRPPRRHVVSLGEGDELLNEALGFFRFGVGRLYRLVHDHGRRQVAQEGLSVGGAAAEGSVFHVPASKPRQRGAEWAVHCVVWCLVGMCGRFLLSCPTPSH